MSIVHSTSIIHGVPVKVNEDHEFVSSGEGHLTVKENGQKVDLMLTKRGVDGWSGNDRSSWMLYVRDSEVEVNGDAFVERVDKHGTVPFFAVRSGVYELERRGVLKSEPDMQDIGVYVACDVH